MLPDLVKAVTGLVVKAKSLPTDVTDAKQWSDFIVRIAPESGVIVATVCAMVKAGRVVLTDAREIESAAADETEQRGVPEMQPVVQNGVTLILIMVRLLIAVASLLREKKT